MRIQIRDLYKTPYNLISYVSYLCFFFFGGLEGGELSLFQCYSQNVGIKKKNLPKIMYSFLKKKSYYGSSEKQIKKTLLTH